MSTFNEAISPHPHFPERGRLEFQEVIGVNSRRQGVSSRQFEEGTGRQNSNRGAFAQGATSSLPPRGDLSERPTQVYEVQVAGQADGRQEPGATNPTPSWNREPALLDQMFWGAGADQGDATPFPFARRAGANPNTITSLAGLNLGERRGTIYTRSIAYNPRRANDADVSDR